MNVDQVNITQSSAELEQLIAAENDAASVRRLSCLRLYRLMAIRGVEEPAAEVARTMDVRESTIRKWLRAYVDHGLDGLLTTGRTNGARRPREAPPSGTSAEKGKADSRQPVQSASAAGSDRRPNNINLDHILSSTTDPSEALETWGVPAAPSGDAPATDDNSHDGAGGRRRAAPARPPIRRAPDTHVAAHQSTVASATERPPVERVAPSTGRSALGAIRTPGSASGSLRPNRADQERKRFARVLSNNPLSGVRILVADVDEMIRTIIRHRLEREGAEVVAVADGMEAVGVIQSEGFDVAVVSASLPGLDGFELTTWLREQTEIRYLPVLMLDWPGDPSVMSRSFEIGADDFLRKPFSPVELIARLGRLLTRRAGGETGSS